MNLRCPCWSSSARQVFLCPWLPRSREGVKIALPRLLGFRTFWSLKTTKDLYTYCLCGLRLSIIIVLEIKTDFKNMLIHLKITVIKPLYTKINYLFPWGKIVQAKKKIKKFSEEWNCSTILQISLMSGLIEHRWILLSASTFHLGILHFGQSIWGKSSLTQVCGWKGGEDILIACPDYFLKVIVCFLNFDYRMASGTTSVNFRSVLLCDSIVYPCVIYSLYWSFRQYWVSDVVVNYITAPTDVCRESPRVDIFHYKIDIFIIQCNIKVSPALLGNSEPNSDGYKFSSRIFA